jgi:hypothetical protein
MTDIKSKVVRKDAGLAADLGDAVASKLAAMKPGESIDFINEQPEKVVTQTAADLGPRPEVRWRLGVSRENRGIGDSRDSETPQYVAQLERRPLAIPGHGRSTSGQSSTTVRADTFAVESDFRVGGNDEGGAFSADKPGPDRRTLEVPDPTGGTNRSAGGPVPAEGARDTNLRRPVSHKHPGEEEGAP